MNRISRQDFPNPDTHNTESPCLETDESELVIGWAIYGDLPYMAPAIAPVEFDSKNITLLMPKMSLFLRMEQYETSHMLFFWILICINVVDDFKSSTDKRERFYDPMDPGLWLPDHTSWSGNMRWW